MPEDDGLAESFVAFAKDFVLHSEMDCATDFEANFGADTNLIPPQRYRLLVRPFKDNPKEGHS